MRAQSLAVAVLAACLLGADKPGDMLAGKVVKIADGDTLMATEQPPAAENF